MTKRSPRVALPELRFARVAAAIGDPTRARMLGMLLAGESLPAGEFARAVNVAAPTASGHLSRLVDEGLVTVMERGRHRYFRLADAEVAQALESLALVAERTGPATLWSREAYRPLKYARTCYRHLAGELGVKLLETMVARGHLASGSNGYAVTRKGRAWLDSLKLEKPLAEFTGARCAYPCLDWSERRDHLAGPLATTLLDHFVSKHWLTRSKESRALKLTPLGSRMLLPMLAE
ncbi:MAG: ArsR/SmtB family transcription factor [Usitatibacter sp.]